jgi:hypothetical protein
MTQTKQPIDTEPVTVAIDSTSRLKGLAGLAFFGAGSKEAFNTVKRLALAAGCHVRGGRIYEPPSWHYGRYAAVARGWDDFVHHASWGTLPPRLRDAMVTQAVKDGTSFSIDGATVATIRAGRR